MSIAPASVIQSRVGLFVCIEGLNLVVVNYDYEDGQPGHRTVYGIRSTILNVLSREVRTWVNQMSDLNRFGGKPEAFPAMKKVVLDRITELSLMKDADGMPAVLVELTPRERRSSRVTQSDLAYLATHSGTGVIRPDQRPTRELLPLVSDEIRAEAERIAREDAELSAIAARDID